MPIIKSAKKALRQSKKRRIKNLAKANRFKLAVKEFRKLVAAGKKDEALKLLPKVYKTLDKAAKTHVIHKNKASRLKSNTAKLLAKK